MITITGTYGTAKVFADEVDSTAAAQIKTLLEHPAFRDSRVRVMPDVHAGAGCVIGFTAELKDIVVPNLVGVDIGCGMLTAELPTMDIDYSALDTFIRSNIPSGFNVNKQTDPSLSDDEECIEFAGNIIELARKIGADEDRILKSVGSLGGGNHFIEINIDSNGTKYLVVHSGSRNFGFRTAEYHQKKAQKMCGKAGIDISKSLAYLTGSEREEYLRDMYTAQEYARRNRAVVMSRIVTQFLKAEPLNKFETVHNYIAAKDNIIRKGAISAHKDELVLIPLNMRDGSLLARGRGNPDWNFSAPHGAGRVLSRTQAKKKLSLEEFKRQMKEIYTTSVSKRTLDESPMAYKDSRTITKAVGETIDIIDTLHPVYNFKAS